MRQFGCILVLLGATAGLPAHAENAPPVPRFWDETAAAGIAHVHSGGWEHMVGGGAASFDCNADGLPELFLAGGEGPATFYRNLSRAGSGPLRFAPEPSGLEIEGVAGAYPLDVDDDGHPDLVLLRVGENLAMRGLGDCRFERANELWGFDGGDAWSTAFAATWEAGADWPTLAVGNYIDRREEDFPWGSCTPNWLHRPVGGAKRGWAPPLALEPSFCALSMLWTDWNRSGMPSLRVSNDREYYKGGTEQLWRIAPGEPPRLFTEAEGWKPLRIWGMGIAGHDLDRDGFPEYFLTSMADNKLQALAAPSGTDLRPSYADIAFAKGVTAHRPHAGGEVKPSTAWHAEFADVNNDGRADLFVAKGNVSDMPDFALRDPDNLLLQREDGSFAEAGEAAGVASLRTGRGAALADFNADGALDLVVVNRGEPAQLWRNEGGLGGWLQVRLRQPGPNRDAIGAWIEVRPGPGPAVRQEITVGGGHAGGQLGWRHFGLGAAKGAEVRVLWPDGAASPWERLAGNGFYVLERGRPAQAWTPR